MLSGRRLDILNPSPVDVEIEDIAHGLSRVARWNGQTKGEQAFSVAQHSVLVERIMVHMKPSLPAQDRLAGLLHDAPEYVMGDVISPFKVILGVGYTRMENRLQEIIHIRFGLPAQVPEKLHKILKRADNLSAYFEAIGLAGFSKSEAQKLWGRPPHGLSLDITPLPPEVAKRVFLERFRLLSKAG